MASSRFSIAVHTLALLARYNGEKPLKSEAVACLVKTNPVVIRRLLSDLAGAGIVISQAGAAGGTRLAKKAEEINLNEVYQAVENGQVFALHRQKPDERCEIGRSLQIVLTEIQNKLDVAIEESLGRINVAQVVEMIESENEKCQAEYEKRKEREF
jgi:Rrf2 family protein